MRPLRYTLRLWPIIPALILATLIAFTLAPNQLAPYAYPTPYPFSECNVLERNLRPSGQYILGTDYLGCDILSMMIYETRPIIIPLALSLVIGIPIGLYVGTIGGYFEGHVSKVILKANNVWLGALAFFILWIILPSSISVPSDVIIGIALLLFLSCLALVRKIPLGILTLTTRDYIHRAKRRGISIPYIVFKSVIPRTSRVILTISVLSALFIIHTYVVSFLSLGITSGWMEWYDDTFDWLMSYSPITRISMYVWVLSPTTTLILLAGWLQSKLPRP